jgi:hypothetical protein
MLGPKELSMKYLLLFILILVTVVSDGNRAASAKATRSSTTSQKITFSGGDGSSIAQAVIIENAKNESDGTEAEYEWVRRKFPGFKFRSKGLVKRGEKQYDHVFGIKADGTSADFYFDITLFFGKM